VLQSRGADAALVTDPVNVCYLTGLASSNAACLVTADGITALATDSRYAEAAARLDDDLETVTDRATAAVLLQRVHAPARVAVEHQRVTVAVMSALRESVQDGVDLVDLDEAVEELRGDKDVAEVALVAQACAISDAALRGLLTGKVRGRTERELARDLEVRMLRLDADGLAFATIVAAGPHGSVPHHAPTDRPVEAGDLLTIDFGAQVGGYHADCTRTVAVGRAPDDWQREVHAVVAAAQQAGIDALAPGTATADVDRAARAVIEESGHGPSFVHGLGHGVGLQIHERPWLSNASGLADRLPNRSTLTVEPGIYLPGRGGVRIEDTIAVGSDGVHVLTATSKALLVVDE
jgi:Xaa-Pro aminopeptidase